MKRLDYIDLTPTQQAYVDDEDRQRAAWVDVLAMLAVGFVLAWIIGIIEIGGDTPVDPSTTTLPAAAYVHPVVD